MRPQILESDVESMEGEQSVEVLHSQFYDDFLTIRNAQRQLPDWLNEQDPGEYEERENYYAYHKYVQGEMTAWLSTLDMDSTVSSDRVRKKYKQFKAEFQEDNPGTVPSGSPSW